MKPIVPSILFLVVLLPGARSLKAAAEAPAGGPRLTLQQAIGLALTNNPELHAAGARVEAAAGRTRQARLWANPELELAVEEWPVGQGKGFSGAKQTVGIAQTLPWPGKKSLDRRIGGAGIRLSEAEASLQRQELVREVKTAFFRVLAAERLSGVAADLVGVAEGLAEMARKRAEAGAMAYQEQLRAEVHLEQARLELSREQEERAAARQELARWLGGPEWSEATLVGALSESAETNLFSGARAALASHPSLRAAQAAVNQAELEYQRVRLDLYPDVKAGVAGGHMGETEESILEVRFSLPLPILDRSQGRRQEAQANVKAAAAQLEGVRLQLESRLAMALQRYRTAAELVAGYRQRVLPKAEEALRLVTRGFEEGKFSFLDLMDTQRTTAEVRRAYQQKLLELNVAQAEVEALGGGEGVNGLNGLNGLKPLKR